jgi:hypothetical protein
VTKCTQNLPFSSFLMYSSMAWSISHCSTIIVISISRLFHLSQQKCYPLNTTPHPPSTSPWKPTCSFLSLGIWHIRITYKKNHAGHACPTWARPWVWSTVLQKENKEEESYNTCPFVTGLLHLASYLQSSSTLQHTWTLHSLHA